MIHTDSFTINSFEVDTNCIVMPAILCGMMQESASRQCFDCGISYYDLGKLNQTWMLARQYVKFAEYPKWRDKVIVETWPRNKSGIRAMRDFILKADNGNEIARSVTHWMLIDTVTRRLLKIDDTVSHLPIVEKSVLDDPNYKIKVEKFDGEKLSAVFKIRPSDFDMNQHVTSICYIKMALDTVPFDYNKTNFVSELFAEYIEEISSEADIESLAFMNGNKFYHELTNLQSGKVVFRCQTEWQAHK